MHGRRSKRRTTPPARHWIILIVTAAIAESVHAPLTSKTYADIVQTPRSSNDRSAKPLAGASEAQSVSNEMRGSASLEPANSDHPQLSQTLRDAIASLFEGTVRLQPFGLLQTGSALDNETLINSGIGPDPIITDIPLSTAQSDTPSGDDSIFPPNVGNAGESGSAGVFAPGPYVPIAHSVHVHKVNAPAPSVPEPGVATILAGCTLSLRRRRSFAALRP